jgi:hypothetical protein
MSLIYQRQREAGALLYRDVVFAGFFQPRDLRLNTYGCSGGDVRAKLLSLTWIISFSKFLC